MTFKLKMAAAAATIALLGGSGTAQALITYDFLFQPAGDGSGRTTIYSNTTVVDFNGAGDLGLPYTEDGVTYTGSGRLVTGSVGGQYAAPPGDVTRYLTVPEPNQNPIGSTTVTITLPGPNNYFGLFWGSGDTYNDITFYLGNTEVESINGAEISPGNGDQGPDGATYLNIYLTGGDLYDKIVISSTQYAFESDNHAFGRDVPEPATLGLLGAGLLGLALRSRKRR